MKIAHLTPTFDAYSGIDRVVCHLAAGQAARGDQVTIFALAGGMAPPPGVTLEVMGMPRQLTLQRIYRLLLPLDIGKTCRWLPRLKDFDVIYCHFYPMTWFGYRASKRYGVRYIYYDYGIASSGTFSNIVENIYMRLLAWLTARTAKAADGAISISRYLQEQLNRETGLTSQVVYPEIDFQRFHPGLDGSPVRERHHLAGGKLIVYTGRISPHKGAHLLIAAFRVVHQAVPDATLLIIGQPTFPAYSRRLKQMADSAVIFDGYVPDDALPAYYAAADVYATATLWEGFNLPLVEAQACGTPVVAFRLGPHPEVVADGETGYLVPPEDTGALAEAIIRLLKDDKLRQEMGQRAARMVTGRFAGPSP
ncbi:MAG: glycosyltransferase family 4 protein [Chloroflexota bacterium]